MSVCLSVYICVCLRVEDATISHASAFGKMITEVRGAKQKEKKSKKSYEGNAIYAMIIVLMVLYFNEMVGQTI